MKTSSGVPRPDDPRNRFDLLDSAILTVVGIFGATICLAYGLSQATKLICKKTVGKVASKIAPNIWF